MVPQAALVPVVRRAARRKWVWVTGTAGMAAAVVAMAVFAASTGGSAAGWGILTSLAAFAVARSLASISSKDVLGRTVPKGQRGRVNRPVGGHIGHRGDHIRCGHPPAWRRDV